MESEGGGAGSAPRGLPATHGLPRLRSLFSKNTGDMSGLWTCAKKTREIIRETRTDDLENSIPARLVEAIDLLVRHAHHLLNELSTRVCGGRKRKEKVFERIGQ